MAAKKAKITPQLYLHSHKDGRLRAKGQVLDDAVVGDWEWYRKTERSCDPVPSRTLSRSANGRRTTGPGSSSK